ncbi:MAG: hypothetical protein AAF368_13140, partial [Planctomycetota bacterium]
MKPHLSWPALTTALLALGWTLGDGKSPSELDTAGISAAIALLRSDTVKSDYGMTEGATERLVRELQDFLDRQVEGKRGPELLAHYTERLTAGDQEAMSMLARS